MLNLVLTASLAVLGYMTLLFILAQILKNNSIVDIAWGFGFIIVVACLFIQSPEIFPSKVLLSALITIWGLRLSGHILLRNFGKPEDFRYEKMRKDWGKAFLIKSFFFVFMLQGALMLVISFSATVLYAAGPRGLNALDFIGAAVFLIGFLFETIGDYQLAQHLKKPANKGKLMTKGLWAFTRHPNYFGEATMWWGIFFIALSSANGWMAVISPLTITFLLVFVSGVPLLEKKYAGRPDWEKYRKRTPVFFPWFPGKK